MPSSRDGEFLALWAEYGDSLSWDEYARRLSRKTEEPISGQALKMWVGRNRDRLNEEYGVEVRPRLVRADEEFEAWPMLPRELRNQSAYRLLEYHARVRALGIDELAPSIRDRYLTRTARMRKQNEIIRYDPGYGLYFDERSPAEVRADPAHERISEKREVYEARQRQRRGEP